MKNFILSLLSKTTTSSYPLDQSATSMRHSTINIASLTVSILLTALTVVLPCKSAYAEDTLRDSTVRFVSPAWNLEIPYDRSLLSPVDAEQLPDDVILMLTPTADEFPIIATTTVSAPLPQTILEDIKNIYKQLTFTITEGPQIIAPDLTKTAYRESPDSPEYITYARYLRIDDHRHVILSSITTRELAESPATLASIDVLKKSGTIEVKFKRDYASLARRNIGLILVPAMMVVVFFGLIIWYQSRKRSIK